MRNYQKELDAIIERQRMDEPNFWEILVERMQLSRLVHLPLEPVDGIDNVLFEVGRIVQHCRLVPLLAARKEVAVVHVVEGCKSFKHMRVLFHLPSLPEGRSWQAPCPKAGTPASRHIIFLSLLTEETDPFITAALKPDP